jgi:hypothetical protein
MTSIGGQVNFTALSDERIKERVTEDVIGLPFIMKLRPVTYYFSMRSPIKSKALKIPTIGKVNTISKK